VGKDLVLVTDLAELRLSDSLPGSIQRRLLILGRVENKLKACKQSGKERGRDDKPAEDRNNVCKRLTYKSVNLNLVRAVFLFVKPGIPTQGTSFMVTCDMHLALRTEGVMERNLLLVTAHLDSKSNAVSRRYKFFRV
jgi:hypothetical protein